MNTGIDIVLGTMTFGEQIFEEADSIINAFLESGYNRLDTAYVYNDGLSEEILGKILKKVSRERVLIDTKVNPRVTGRLDANAIKMQLETSLNRLGTDYVNTLYLHFPDKNVPLEETLMETDNLYRHGQIRELGLSNYSAEMVERAYLICEENGWICPTVYEGLYNPLSRKIEILESTLEKYGIRLYSYNPLAGGILTDKYHSYEENPSEGRFTHRPNYQNRYWKKSYFIAKELVDSVCRKYSISLIEASFRWLAYSSMLNIQRNDGIIIGVSKPHHLQVNIECIKKGILPHEVADAFNEAWEICREDAPDYYRFV